MMNNKIEHIFFDLDHTLWDFDKNSEKAFEMLFKKFKIQVALEDFQSIYRPINLKYWKLYREERVAKLDLRRSRLIETFDHFGVKFSLDIIDEISDDYINFLPLNNHLIPGTQELLSYLEPKYRLHIITNGFREVQHTKLSNSGILNYFQTVTNSEDAGVKKPNPQIFNHALQISGAEIDESMMIGDNYEADILGAEAIGFKTICFNYHRQKLPHHVVQVLELKELKRHI